MVSAGAFAGALLNLFASPHWSRLLTLDLHGNGADDAVVEALADGRFPDLTELWLGSCPLVGDTGGRALYDSPHLGGLRVLDLRGTLVRNPAVVQNLRRRFGSKLQI
jgi:hypothetical protein